MAEYIERAKVFEAYNDEQKKSGCWRFETLIESIPAADAAPVVHGRWVHDPASSYGVNIWFCSACNGEATRKYNYCPSCGAKMDGGAIDGVDQR